MGEMDTWQSLQRIRHTYYTGRSSQKQHVLATIQPNESTAGTEHLPFLPPEEPEV